MQCDLRDRVTGLQCDFQNVTGTKFEFFYCPILYRDEDTELCKGHIVNRVLPDSPRNWTVQRKDVDGFFGSVFESDFSTIVYRGKPIAGEAVVDKEMSKALKPTLLANGTPIDYYRTTSEGSSEHTKVKFEFGNRSAELWLRISPNDLMSMRDVRWEIAVEKDIRVAAFVSLIKAAHLTLFHLLGYRYALSAGGHFIGRELLGEFYLAHSGYSKQEAAAKAIPFFVKYQHLVRPILSTSFPIEGTLSDKQMLICRNPREQYWGFIVFVNIAGLLHAVLIPTFITPEDSAFYLDFMQNEHETLDVCWARFLGDHWEISKAKTRLKWPKTGVLLK